MKIALFLQEEDASNKTYYHPFCTLHNFLNVKYSRLPIQPLTKEFVFSCGQFPYICVGKIFLWIAENDSFDMFYKCQVRDVIDVLIIGHPLDD